MIKTKGLNVKGVYCGKDKIGCGYNGIYNIFQSSPWTVFVNSHPAFAQLLSSNPTLKTFYESQGLITPLINSTDGDHRMWMVRQQSNYTGWNDIDNVLSKTDWSYKKGGFGNNAVYTANILGTNMTSNGNTILCKLFVPTVMPTGYTEGFADYACMYVNGTKIFESSSYHQGAVSHTYDFSNIIQLNKVNYVIMRWYGGGNHGINFGFNL